MSCIKKIITLSLLITPLFISTNSFAFNLPKEFASIGTQSLSKREVFTEQTISNSSISIDNSNKVRSAILAEYSNWKGTRYHWGGTSRKGVDCSALMQHIFSESLHKELPRTTSEQIHNGQKVSKETLKPGDLVFFKTSSTVRHVGVYVGDNQFIHASSSNGVTISSLGNNYWAEHYETARRLKTTS